jgi:putative oxidoreductase
MAFMIFRSNGGHIFLIAGINKIGGYDGTVAYMEAMGVPGAFSPGDRR